ncbi:MAG: hypothetical protein JW902_07325 [Syntrophaceae bacterium]|nr:hypothetical protein [Syntrophaceae bacterium]
MNNLTLPSKLVELIEHDLWPKKQLISGTLFSEHVMQQFFPNEDNVCFYVPPFRTIAEYIACDGEKYWLQEPLLKIEQVDIEKTLILADFGLGSDTYLALDYRQSPEPSVIKLVPNQDWKTLAHDFAQFSRELNLEQVFTRKVWYYYDVDIQDFS